MGMTFLTGASSGLGHSLARRLAAQGEAVALVARRLPLLQELQAEIERAGGQALALQCDVTDRLAVHAALQQAEAAFGAVTRLIANAGGPGRLDAEHFSAEAVQEMMDRNFTGAVNCLEAVLPGMLERRGGHIVATSSLAAYRGLPAAGSYSAAKAALTCLLEGLRLDLAPHGIKVTVIAPGFVRTKPQQRKKKYRPFRLELEDATARMCRAIMAERPYYAFPKPLVALAWLGRVLPVAGYDWLVRGKGPKAKPETPTRGS